LRNVACGDVLRHFAVDSFVPQQSTTIALALFKLRFATFHLLNEVGHFRLVGGTLEYGHSSSYWKATGDFSGQAELDLIGVRT